MYLRSYQSLVLTSWARSPCISFILSMYICVCVCICICTCICICMCMLTLSQFFCCKKCFATTFDLKHKVRDGHIWSAEPAMCDLKMVERYVMRSNLSLGYSWIMPCPILPKIPVFMIKTSCVSQIENFFSSKVNLEFIEACFCKGKDFIKFLHSFLVLYSEEVCWAGAARWFQLTSS